MKASPRSLLTVIAAAVTVSPSLLAAQALEQFHGPHQAGALFIMSNAAAKNEVISFQRAADGKLYDPDRYETGGRGSGGLTDPLESQGSLSLSQDHSFLFAVNAGSGSVSVFGVRGAHLLLIDRTPSGGSQPVAVAQWKNLVYVLNSGGSGSVVGFRFNEDGHLTLIPNSTTFLSANATGGASITISPDGQFLAVTERLANLIDTFRIMADGTLTPIVENPSAVPGTFSAQFAPGGSLIVSETGPAGVTNGSTISSYSVVASGHLSGISQGVPTFGAANCWNAITPDGKRVYVSNAGSDNISGFAIASNGALSPIGPSVVGSNPDGSGNLDVAITAHGEYLYSLNSGSGTIGIFAIEKDGTLKNLGEAGDFPAKSGFNGIAAF
jgi:6-phosphogluconolactonase